MTAMADIDSDAVATWDERAATWDDRTETHVYAEQAFATLAPVVAAELGGWSQLRVLDFGAGTGLLTEKLAPLCREVVASDLSPKMIQILNRKADAKGWSNVTSLEGDLDLTSAELRKNFDLIVASSVCSFLPDFSAELSRLSSTLRPGGLFVQWDWLADAAGDWARGLTPEAVRSAYQGASLEVVSVGRGFMFSFDGNTMEVLQGVGRRL